MPYLLAILFAAGFGSGFFIEHQINKAEIQRMELSITVQNDNAAALLKAKTNEVAAATEAANKINSNLDKAHEAFIATTNNYDRQLDSISLYAERRPCSPSATTASESAGVSKETASEAGFPEELDRLVKEKARIADEAADYADKAYQFAAVNNCGLTKSSEAP